MSFETNATFRPASMSIEDAVVTCDWTQIFHIVTLLSGISMQYNHCANVIVFNYLHCHKTFLVPREESGKEILTEMQKIG